MAIPGAVSCPVEAPRRVAGVPCQAYCSQSTIPTETGAACVHASVGTNGGTANGGQPKRALARGARIAGSRQRDSLYCVRRPRGFRI